MSSSQVWFSPKEDTILSLCVHIFSLVGLSAPLFTLIAFAFSNILRKSILAKTAFVIALADLISIFSQSFGRFAEEWDNDTVLCQTQAFLQLWGELITIFLVASIAVNLLLVTRFDYDFGEIAYLERYYIVGVMMMSGVMAGIPLFLKDENKNPVFGPSPLWCFFSETSGKLYWILYAPLFFVFILGLVVFFLVRYTMREREMEDSMFRGFEVGDPRLNLLPSIVALFLLGFLFIWSPVVIMEILGILGIHYGFATSLTIAIFVTFRGIPDMFVVFYQAWMSREEGEDGEEEGMLKVVWKRMEQMHKRIKWFDSKEKSKRQAIV